MNMNENRKEQEATNSGTRPFSPIYNNFQNLLENNQGVFRLFRKAKNPGMYQAVWLSRQAEVETYRERLLQSESKQQIIKDDLESVILNLEVKQIEEEKQWQLLESQWFEQHNDQRQAIEFLEARLQEAREKIQNQKEEAIKTDQNQKEELLKLKNNHAREKQALKKDLLAQREETEKFRILSRSLERVIKMNTHKDSKYEDQIKKLETHLTLSQHALIKLDSEYDNAQIEAEELKNRLYELEEKFHESERYNKEFKRINHRMENELYRVTTELENIQSYMN